MTHTTVIMPFLHENDLHVLQWTLEGFAQQQLEPSHSLDVLIGVDGGDGIELRLPPMPDDRFKVLSFSRIGSAAVRNALVGKTDARTDLLIFVNADTRPDPAMVQCHADTMLKLPPGSLVLGSAPRERHAQATVLDVLLDETPAIYAYALMKPESWHDFRSTNALNLSIRRDQFLASDQLPEVMRPRSYEDTVFTHRLLGGQPRIFHQPRAGVVHRHPMSLDQYLDREELLGMMAPVLAQVAPDTFASFFGAATTVRQLAQRYSLWTMMDAPVHRSAYESLNRCAAERLERLADPQSRMMLLSALYNLHVPLKRLAFRLGFLKGMELVDDSHWPLRRPQGLWRKALQLPETGHV
jgi:hypothetical protein